MKVKVPVGVPVKFTEGVGVIEGPQGRGVRVLVRGGGQDGIVPVRVFVGVVVLVEVLTFVGVAVTETIGVGVGVSVPGGKVFVKVGING